VLTIGCAATNAQPEPSPGIEPYEISCDASRASSLIGKLRGAQAAAEAMRLSEAVIARWIGPFDGVTSDHNSGRINLEVDRAGRIVGVRCG
jgi:hypothetical protein